MSSGCYFPPPVRAVSIPKNGDGERILGIPTVSDRIAQMVVTMFLEPLVDSGFHEDSYGYRPRKSAHDALARARQRCWKFDWVLDLDIRAFFDNLDHALALRAVKKHTSCPWVLLYIERWLKAPLKNADGSITIRDKGTPQGGCCSPLISNIFMHHAFDEWMRTTFPQVPFERFADDCLVHCKSERHANIIKDAIKLRLE